MKRIRTKDEFLNKAQIVHKGKYDYSNVEYKGSKHKIKIVCSIHGLFTQRPDHHLSGSGCTKCNITYRSNKQRRSVEDFIENSLTIHNNKYNYSKTVYKNHGTKLTITCPIHGDFEQTPNNHLDGRGCDKCARDVTNFKLKDWSKMCPGNPGIFYILRCWNDDEEFYKVGITCNSVEFRFRGSLKIPYNYEIVKQIIDQDRERIWKLEKTYLSLLKDYHYEPKIKFGGSIKECFKL